MRCSPRSRSDAAMDRSPEQLRRFFSTFGHVVLPGALREEIAWISDEFEALLREEGLTHDGSKRTCVNACIERRERLCSIIDLPQLTSLVSTLLGPDWNYYS